MVRSIANTYICINNEGQTLSIIARTGNEAHNIAKGFLRNANIVSVRRVFKSGKLGKEILKRVNPSAIFFIFFEKTIDKMK